LHLSGKGVKISIINAAEEAEMKKIGVTIFIILMLFFSGWAEAEPEIKIFVSIPPQAWIVGQVGGDLVQVSVLVGPGQSPATYEPTPRQMARLSEADVYFRIGVPFEKAWIDKIRHNNPDLKIVDLRQGIQLRQMESHRHEGHGHHEAHGGQEGHEHSGEHREGKDPHIWLDPLNAKRMAETVCQTLVEILPSQKQLFQTHLEKAQAELESVHQKVSELLAPFQGRKFMVFHPAWGYFADRYGLEQVAVEIEGKEPSARELVRVSEQAKAEGLDFIVVQKQFSTKTARMVADSIGGEVLQLDPLSEDYAENLIHIADTLSKELK
jgi:zinc transport system substrate-binding protein